VRGKAAGVNAEAFLQDIVAEMDEQDAGVNADEFLQELVAEMDGQEGGQ
jgi:hypothetical protein